MWRTDLAEAETRAGGGVGSVRASVGPSVVASARSQQPPGNLARPDEDARFKRCSACGERKPLEDFWSNRRRYDGRAVYCKACGHPHKPLRPPAMLPAEPLLGPLREVTGERGNRGSRNGEPGVHRLAARMVALFGGSYETYQAQVDRILRGSVTRIHYTTADRLALALGFHPAQIWGTDW